MAIENKRQRLDRIICDVYESGNAGDADFLRDIRKYLHESAVMAQHLAQINPDKIMLGCISAPLDISDYLQAFRM